MFFVYKSGIAVFLEYFPLYVIFPFSSFLPLPKYTDNLNLMICTVGGRFNARDMAQFDDLCGGNSFNLQYTV